eukprot:1157997-Pelagomonas_calceolata.AAC.9
MSFTGSWRIYHVGECACAACKEPPIFPPQASPIGVSPVWLFCTTLNVPDTKSHRHDHLVLAACTGWQQQGCGCTRAHAHGP